MKPLPGPSFAEAFRFWLKLGFISFGGPAGQLAIMHEELVVKRRWIPEAHFLHALNFCMLLPGPEAQQLAIYSGWLLHGKRGGLVAGTLFVLPSAVILWTLSYAYMVFGTWPTAEGLFSGLKLAVVAIVAAAAVRIGRKVLKNWALAGLAAGAFALMYAKMVPFPLIIAGAGIVGWLSSRFPAAKLGVPDKPGVEIAILGVEYPHQAASVERVAEFWSTLKTLGVGALCWWLPIVGLGGCLGWQHTIFQQTLFFSKAAVVTFGGAYAVLPYVAQEAVENYGWLAPGQMLDGFGLAETTPGPLIIVLQFVGFVGAWQHPMGLPPLTAATLGAAVTTWVTFVPCFLWIFLGAPYVERMRTHQGLTAALAGISAAVAGVIANMALHFGAQVLFPGRAVVDWLGLALVVVGFAGLARWNWGVIPVILGAATVGLARSFFGL